MVWHILSIVELFLFAGVYFPLIIDEFWVFTNEFFNFSLLYTLLLNNEILLSLIVSVFGFVFPQLRLLLNFPIRFFYFIKIHKFGISRYFSFKFSGLYR